MLHISIVGIWQKIYCALQHGYHIPYVVNIDFTKEKTMTTSEQNFSDVSPDTTSAVVSWDSIFAGAAAIAAVSHTAYFSCRSWLFSDFALVQYGCQRKCC
jgi:hypothetical protein